MGEKIQKLAQPKINTWQIILFGLLSGWTLISNLKEFQTLALTWQIGISITFYIAIMLTANQRGKIGDLVKSLIGIIGSADPNDTKMIKLQNLLVAICQELGILYEKELEKLNGYVKEQKEANIADLKTEISLLREQLKTAS